VGFTNDTVDALVAQGGINGVAVVLAIFSQFSLFATNNSRVVCDSFLGAQTVYHANAHVPVTELGCVPNLFQMLTRQSIYVTYVNSDYLMSLHDRGRFHHRAKTLLV
jgi:hypothetical protein